MNKILWGGVKTLTQGDVKAAVLAALNALNAKAGRPKAYIVETWVSGSRWYRVWNDGFIEQGGTTVAIPSDSPRVTSVSFSKAFKNSPLFVTRTNLNLKDNPCSNFITGINSVTRTYVEFVQDSRLYSNGSLWYACGY